MVCKASFNSSQHVARIFQSSLRVGNFTLRKSRSQDEQALSDFFQGNKEDVCQFLGVDDLPSYVSNTAYYKKCENFGYLDLFAFDKQKVIGRFLIYPDPQGHTRVSYFVARDYRGKGIASALYKAVVDRLQKYDRPVTVFIPQENKKSLRFMMKNDLYPVSRRQCPFGYYSDMLVFSPKNRKNLS